MKILAGTSGYAFKEWKGNFYPQDLKDDGMLGYYASRFPTVAINNTFYRLPRENVLREWAAQVPENFTFALKASQRITHYARLKEEGTAIIQQLAGGPQGIAEVLAELESGVRADVAALQVALESANGLALRRAAHRIKGSALTIGAESLAALATRVVDAPADIDAAQLMSSAHALLDELQRVLVSARAHRNAPSS